jgi:4-diphosphocytidyl-2-C-methyl-D-erythritol kinase
MKGPAVRLKAWAEVNLSLRILGKRTDGYRQLDSLMVPVDLSDTVEMVLDPGARSIRISCPAHEHLESEDNLAYRAAEEWRKQVKSWSGGLSITIRKNIPVASGLAGGSADAAAVLRGLCRLLGTDAQSPAVRSVCESLGSDVPFCFAAQPSWVGGRGEILSPIPDFPELDLCVVCPDIEVSSAWAYGQVSAPALNWEAVRELQRRSVPELGPEIGALGPLVHNDLWAVVSRFQDSLPALGRRLDQLGCVTWSMSGSGPAVFGLFHSASEALEACRYFQNSGNWARCCRSVAGPDG